MSMNSSRILSVQRELERDEFIFPFEQKASGLKRQKCPYCRKLFLPHTITFASAEGIDNCTNRISTIVTCSNCGMRIAYSAVGRGKIVKDKNRKLNFVQKFAACAVAAIIAIGFMWSLKRAQNYYNTGLEAYYSKSYTEACEFFKQGAYFFNPDSKAMYVWCAANGFDPDIEPETIKKKAEKLTAENPYADAAKALFAELDEQYEEAAAYYLSCVKKLENDDDLIYHSAIPLWEMQGTDEMTSLELETLQKIEDLHDLGNLPPSDWNITEANIKKLLVEDIKQEEDYLRDFAWWLGSLYWKGTSVPQDDQKAINLWKYAAEHGQCEAMLRLARLYQYGSEPYCCKVKIEPSAERAYFLASAANKFGNVDGTVLLAEYTMNGIGTKPDTLLTTTMLSDALANNSGAAACLLGDVVSEPESKLAYYRLAYETYGCVKGLVRLGICQLEGRFGYPKDETEGWKNLLKAAEQGDTEALMACSAKYYSPHYSQTGDTDSEIEGLRCLKRAASERDENYFKVLNMADSMYHVQLEFN